MDPFFPWASPPPLPPPPAGVLPDGAPQKPKKKGGGGPKEILPVTFALFFCFSEEFLLS